MLNNSFRERIVRAFLDVAILARLEGEPLNGYDLTNFFIKKFGAVISTSTVYSTLYSMERNGLINGRYDRRSRVYELTEKGKKKLEHIRNMLYQIQALVKKLLASY
jgi:DNA-binding PadR family transcriptional regulator